MTVATGNTRKEYTATAGQTVFNYTFKIFDSGDLNVYQTLSGNEASDNDLITAYTVTGVGDENGGTIVLTTGAGVNDKITIDSDIPDSRTTDYQFNGDFIPQTVNDDFDRVVSLVKQLQTAIERVPQFGDALQAVTGLTFEPPVANQFLRWDNTATKIEGITLNTAEDATNAAAVSYSPPVGTLWQVTDVQAFLDQVVVGGPWNNLNIEGQLRLKRATDEGAAFQSILTDGGYVCQATDNSSAIVGAYNFDSDGIRMTAAGGFKPYTFADLAAIDAHFDATPGSGVTSMIVSVGSDLTTAKLAYYNGSDWKFIADDSNVT